MKTLIKMHTTNGGWCSMIRFLFLVSVFSLSAQAFAQNNSIKHIVASQQGDKVTVKVTMQNPLATVPVGFSTTTPPRIALDFPATNNETEKSTITVPGNSNVRSINIVQAGERSRLVFNLTKPLDYTSVIENNLLIITIDGSGGEVTTALTSHGPLINLQEKDANSEADKNTNQSEKRSANNSEGRGRLRDIDFRKGVDGEGRIVVDLPESPIDIDVRQQGNTIVAEFAKIELPEALRRRLDVVDFGTPVRTITTTAGGDKVRMVIDPQGQWEHSVYRTAAQLVIEVRPLKIDPTKLTQGTQGYRGEKLSLNFQDVDVRALLQVVAEVSGFSIIASDSVTGRMTLRLKDIAWDQALEIIMQSKGLDMRKSGTVIMVAPKDELLTKEKLEAEQKSQIGDLEPLKTESFQLNYQKVASFKAAFGLSGSNPGIRILSKRGSAVVDERTNQMFVTDVPSRLEAVRQLVQKTDIASRQVLIEARLVVATDNWSKNLGATLGFTDMRTMQGGVAGFPVDGRNAALSGTYQGISDQTMQTSVNKRTEKAFSQAGQFFSLPAEAINARAPGSLAVSLFSPTANRFLNLEISALEADGAGKVISSPRLVTADQVPAIVEQGNLVPYQQATSSGATAVAFQKANLKLEVTPQITPDGNIILDVEVNNDSVGLPTPAGFQINTQHLKTIVMVDNGGTVLLGGIYQETVQDTVTKIPFLGDLPLLGYLFKNTNKTKNKNELLIFLTPKIIADRAAVIH
ncbi:MAG: type pilus secretin PilQ [Solimicrobium sp.]|jgi:type IV pilus assembly protein PilQ|nr:type pilus secretin PilQ [Solimicrobium sp.]